MQAHCRATGIDDSLRSPHIDEPCLGIDRWPVSGRDGFQERLNLRHNRLAFFIAFECDRLNVDKF